MDIGVSKNRKYNMKIILISNLYKLTLESIKQFLAYYEIKVVSIYY